jgi:hypothetical protein
MVTTLIKTYVQVPGAKVIWMKRQETEDIDVMSTCRHVISRDLSLRQSNMHLHRLHVYWQLPLATESLSLEEA